MRSIWKGSISFGLVNIPIALFTATRREELKFHLLRKSDLSPVNYKRVAAVDQKEVPWEEIVKGYEHEKGKFVILKDDDFARVDLEATQTVEIIDFVDLKEVSPIFFHKPYYMEPQKGGDHAYALLRDALNKTGKIGIAKVVIKTRQYLAGVRPQEGALMLELMHFAEELVEADALKIPSGKQKSGPRELEMATSLIESMTSEWDPTKYHDEYREALEKVIQEKIEHPEQKQAAAAAPRQATKVIDLVAVLQKSLAAQSKPVAEHSAKKKTPTRGAKKKKPALKKAA